MLYKAISKWSAPQQGCRFREVAAITAAVPAMENSPMVSGFLVSTRAPWPASLPPWAGTVFSILPNAEQPATQAWPMLHLLPCPMRPTMPSPARPTSYCSAKSILETILAKPADSRHPAAHTHHQQVIAPTFNLLKARVAFQDRFTGQYNRLFLTFKTNAAPSPFVVPSVVQVCSELRRPGLPGSRLVCYCRWLPWFLRVAWLSAFIARALCPGLKWCWLMLEEGSVILSIT